MGSLVLHAPPVAAGLLGVSVDTVQLWVESGPAQA